MDQMANMADFTKLVEAGSFSAAAREMQVSSRRARHQVDPGAGKPAFRASDRAEHRVRYRKLSGLI